MKMITAIVNKHDSDSVSQILTEKGFTFTKIATVGGFLRSGNTTFLMGVDDEKLELALKLIRDHCSRRTEKVPVPVYTEHGAHMLNSCPVPVAVGGATVFITNIEYFEKM